MSKTTPSKSGEIKLYYSVVDSIVTVQEKIDNLKETYGIGNLPSRLEVYIDPSNDNITNIQSFIREQKSYTLNQIIINNKDYFKELSAIDYFIKEVENSDYSNTPISTESPVTLYICRPSLEDLDFFLESNIKLDSLRFTNIAKLEEKKSYFKSCCEIDIRLNNLSEAVNYEKVLKNYTDASTIVNYDIYNNVPHPYSILEYLTERDFSHKAANSLKLQEQIFVTKFLRLIPESGLTVDSLNEIIKQLREETKFQDGNIMTYSKALRLVSEVDFTITHTNNAKKISDTIKSLQSNQKAIPTSYHVHDSSANIDFYITKVTDSNYKDWHEYCSKASAKGNASIGGGSFFSSIDFYDHVNTDIWVSYISDKHISNPSIPDNKSIEMVVTMMTSKNALWSSHVGIFRSSLYNGNNHSNVSMKLHDFTAKATSMLYPEKLYMINVPAEVMLEIILKSTEKKYGSIVGHIYYGNGQKPYEEAHATKYEIEKLKSKLNNKENPIKDTSDRHSIVMKAYFSEQNIALENKEFEPFILMDNNRPHKEFKILDPKSKQYISFNEAQLNSELGWFSYHDHLINYGTAPKNMISVLLGDLGGLYDYQGHKIQEVAPLGSNTDAIIGE